MRGGKYLAEDRGAFLAEESVPLMTVIASHVEPVTVPLYEAAAAHDGQPATDWLRVFKAVWNAE